MVKSAKQRQPGNRTSHMDWIHVARQTLVAEGVEKVKVLCLARRLGVSRSSFYWFFQSRKDLLDQLLDSWVATNTASIVERANRRTDTIAEAVLNVFECWIDEDIFDPRLDFAIREWARRSTTVRRIVDEADEMRIAAIAAMYRRHGYEDPHDFIRARILYFMQIGYYSLVLTEPIEQRLSYVSAYVRGFTGQDATCAELERFCAFARRQLHHTLQSSKSEQPRVGS